MSYSAPVNRAVGYLVGAAIWNQDVKDNIIALHDPPACRVYHNTTQTASHLVTTALAFNSERFDNAVIHDTVTNNTRLTAPLAGVYLISGGFAGTWAKGTIFSQIQENNGFNIAVKAQRQPNATPSFTAISVSGHYKLAANDYVRLFVSANLDAGSGSITINSTGNYTPEFGMEWIGAGV